jgi:subtilisin
VAKLRQYILLPPRGLTADVVSPTTPLAKSFLLALEAARASPQPIAALAAAKIRTKLRVLDSIRDTGAKLVELAPDQLPLLRAEQPGLRVVPVVYYYPARLPRPKPLSAPQKAQVMVAIRLAIVSASDDAPVAGATVVAFTDFENRVGAEGTTDAKGMVSLKLGGASKKVERLYVYPKSGYWSALKKDTTLASGTKIPVQPIRLDYTDALRHFYAASSGAGSGVTVGVVDTGVGPHPDLHVDGGENTVPGESAQDYGDNGEGHGTHVGGIIAARGVPPAGIQGVAPAVRLRSYRVFPKSGEGASNYAIAKALDRAVEDGCDLVNMSLGGGPQDEAVHSALAHARANGVLIFVANGNDGRQAVSWPAADSLAIAISAMGRKGTFPSGTSESAEVAAPYGTDKKNFIAAFSNIGPETDLTDTGVGIISTVPGGYGVMSGTSMACPAATGAAARLLAAKPDILAMARDQARSEAMAAAALDAAKPLGFGALFEGRGML